jgi:hypothetical protein
MTPNLKTSTLQLLKRFNKTFPQFYEQFVSSEMQLQNLQLAYKVYNSQLPVVEIGQVDEKSQLCFAFRNQSYLLRDIFGILFACQLTIHSISLYGQVQTPMLVFIQLELSKDGRALEKELAAKVCRAIRETLAGRIEVDQVLKNHQGRQMAIASAETEFYIDPVFNLPTLLVEADNQHDLFYKVANAIWHEDLLIINATSLAWRGRNRLILYLLGPDESLIPDYLGQKIAESVKRRLQGPI